MNYIKIQVMFCSYKLHLQKCRRSIFTPVAALSIKFKRLLFNKMLNEPKLSTESAGPRASGLDPHYSFLHLLHALLQDVATHQERFILAL